MDHLDEEVDVGGGEGGDVEAGLESTEADGVLLEASESLVDKPAAAARRVAPEITLDNNKGKAQKSFGVTLLLERDLPTETGVKLGRKLGKTMKIRQCPILFGVLG